jgi:hypothetical protein
MCVCDAGRAIGDVERLCCVEELDLCRKESKGKSCASSGKEQEQRSLNLALGKCGLTTPRLATPHFMTVLQHRETPTSTS